MAVERTRFGTSCTGADIYCYTISNQGGMQAVLTNLGAALVKLFVPDREGKAADVVLGFDNVEDYEKNPNFFGTVIGPSANRIAGAAFSIDGKVCRLQVNDNENNLHSHMEIGYHKRIWEAVCNENSVTFTLKDTDQNMGFPGNKSLAITYCLRDNNELELHYHASADEKTIINLTNHTYFNLDGHDSGSIEQHELCLKASAYTPVVAGAIPTGEIAGVCGTPMDFTQEKKIGQEIRADFEQLNLTGGYDHNYVIDHYDGELRLFAVVKAPVSGRVMKAYTNLPGVQFYAGNFIDRQQGKDGVIYDKRHAFCLETQYYPDAVHHPNFPSCIFGGEQGDYDSVTIYRFEV